MAVLEPRLAILDETDSGLDIDALRAVAEGVDRLARRARHPGHHPLSAPARFHPAGQGARAAGPDRPNTGGKELALELEKRGYDWLEQEVAHGHAA